MIDWDDYCDMQDESFALNRAWWIVNKGYDSLPIELMTEGERDRLPDPELEDEDDGD